MGNELSISRVAGEATTKAIDIYNKFKFNNQQVAQKQTYPQLADMLAHYSQYSTDAACARPQP